MLQGNECFCAFSTGMFRGNFQPKTADKTFKINKGSLNCNSKKIVFLSECKICKNLHLLHLFLSVCRSLLGLIP